jgi:hypothetical protein
MLDWSNDQSKQQQSKRERARAILRALLAKTVENGCTEEEAAKAAVKANELMLAHDLTLEDAQEVKNDDYGVRRRPYSKGGGHIVRHHEAVDLAGAIAEFCDARIYYSGRNICFFGSRQDTEIAHYLLQHFITSSAGDWQRLRRSGRDDIDTGIGGRKAFMRGYINRMELRLKTLREEREKARSKAPTSNALVVLKKEIVDQRYRKHGVDIGLRPGRTIYRSCGSGRGNYAAGAVSANRTTIAVGAVGTKSVGAIKSSK